MTVSSTTTPRKVYSGNGATISFPITFPYASLSDVIVVHVASDSTETTWILDGAGSTGYAITDGAVVANTAPAEGASLVLYRTTSKTQQTDWEPNKRASAELTESALDKLTYIAQEISEANDRAVTGSITETETVSYVLPSYSASKYLQWHPSDKELRNAEITTATGTVGTDIGDLFVLVDVDDSPGLPVIDGSQLENLTLSQITDAGEAAALDSGKSGGELPTNDDLNAVNALGNLNSATTLSLANGEFITCTITGAMAFTFPAIPTSGARAFTLQITNGGAYTVTWPSSSPEVDWASDTAPDMLASGVDVLSFYAVAGDTNWHEISRSARE